MKKRLVIGIDLAASVRRDTGVCVLDYTLNAKTFIIHTDQEILDIVSSYNPRVAAIDAPLSIPKDRRSIDDRKGGHFRECDRLLLKYKIKFFPITLGPMRMLTERGIRIKNMLEKIRGVKVIEVYPGGAQDVLGIPRKNKSLKGLKEGLERLGIKGLNDEMTGDELDAVTAAYVAYLYLKGDVTLLEGVDGCIVMPKITKELGK